MQITGRLIFPLIRDGAPTYGGGAPEPVLGAQLVAQVEQEAAGLLGAEEEADVGGGGRALQTLRVLQTQRHVPPELHTHTDTAA